MDNIFLIITSVIATLSVIGSLMVVLTFAIFPKLRRRMVMKMIAYISFADFLSNLGYVPLTRPGNGTLACTVQGIFNLTTYPISWLWTLAVVYSLHYMAHYSRTPDNGSMRKLHVICWGIPIVLTCISLGFTKIGREDTYPVFEVCNYYGGLAAEVYHILAYYGLLLLIFGIMVYLQRNIILLEKSNDPRIFVATYTIAKMSLSFYPTLLIICWLPHGIVAIVEYFDPSTNSPYKEAYFVTDMLKILHGLFTAITLFSRSAESRRSWYHLLFHGNCASLDEDEPMMNSVSDISLDDDLNYREFSLYISPDRRQNSTDVI